jgi:hypothetical protein
LLTRCRSSELHDVERARPQRQQPELAEPGRVQFRPGCHRRQAGRRLVIDQADVQVVSERAQHVEIELRPGRGAACLQHRHRPAWSLRGQVKREPGE